MAAGDTITLTRTVTLAANAFVAGTLNNTLASPAVLMSIQSDNSNVLVVSCMADGIPKRLVKVGSTLTVTLLNQAGTSQTATLTLTATEVDPKFGSAIFPQF